MSKRGRPPLPPEGKRTIRKGVAFSAQEYDRLCQTAYKLGIENVNEFIRLMVLPETVNVLVVKYEHGTASTSEATS